ncbi:heparinase II/III family protein [Lichenicoccus roseus]|uniref:Heparinase n=1 Tax=Lichenicoccus roseus TaxID=2683649 RepID=A0A5R9J233_9PROT|nr:heparinase II/III family protein [Lichenicoccus roseus]TLU71700.1 heparinase [Lichenicoccus roseus]
MSVRRWSQDARLSIARLPGLSGGLGLGRIPDAPQQAIRDLWAGDPAIGARIMKGEMHHRGAICPVSVVSVPAIVVHGSNGGAGNGAFGGAPGSAAGVVSPMLRAHAQGFTWLRDLRALNTDSARLRARALVAEWLQRPPNDATARSPDVIGARVAAWLMHYDFFAASADDGFRQRLMARVVIDGRSLMAVLPSGTHDHRTLSAFKGLLACAVALPEQGALLARYMRFITAELGRQVLLDGCQTERSPYAHLVTLRELAEMRALMQTGQIAPPLSLAAALDRMAPALRALRHGDGGLALFNGSQEEDPAHIDQVLMLAARGRAVQQALPEGGFLRLQVGRSLLFVDAGPPAPPGYDALAQAGTLSFELSVGRERLIVNCGASIAAGWQEAMRSTAAHSTLAIGDRSSSDLVEAAGAERAGISRRPAHVEIDHKQSGEAHWLELSQDGYKPAFGAVHRRRLYLAEDGRDIRGEDFVEADRPCAFSLRFHLHPDVEVSIDAEAGGVLLTLPSGGKWRMRLEGGTVTVEESIYLGRGAPRLSRQIVVAVAEPGANPVVAAPPVGPDDAPVDAQNETQAAPGVQAVRWALSSVD